MIVKVIDYTCFFTFLYKGHPRFSILHGITSSSGQLRLEGGVGGEEPSSLLSFCLSQVDIIVVECSHTDNIVWSSGTVMICCSFVLLFLLFHTPCPLSLLLLFSLFSTPPTSPPLFPFSVPPLPLVTREVDNETST